MLKKVSFTLLSPWSPARQYRFLNALPHVTYSDGQIIFSQGDASTDVYFILEGATKSISYSADGKMSFFRLRQAGDCFGYYSGISQKPRTATMIAVSKTVCAKISGEDFFKLVLKHSRIGRNFIKLLAELLRIETERLTHLTTLSAKQRVIAEIVTQVARNASNIFTIPSQAEFATYLGLTRETLSRILHQLINCKCIELKATQIKVIDSEKLNLMLYQAYQE